MTIAIAVRLDDAKLRELIRRAPTLADAALEALAREGEAMIVRSFNTSPPGRTYRIRRSRRTHVASRAGYPPNVLTGKLRGSINVRRPRQLERVINTGDTEYAAALEFGSPSRGLAPRPFMRPAVFWMEEQSGRVFDGFLEGPSLI